MPDNRVTEAANRAEVTALLIRCSYRVYRPEVDIDGEDLVVRTPAEVLIPVQLKGRACVDEPRYGHHGIWMLFPSARYAPEIVRHWYLVPHDTFYPWVQNRHGHAPGWNQTWSYPMIGQDLREFLSPFVVRPPADPVPTP